MHDNGRSVRTWDRALVTGASSGIGRAVALSLAEAGTELVVVARDAQRLEALATDVGTRHGVACEVLPADLARSSDVERVAARLQVVESPIDLLVNNAGFGAAGGFADVAVERHLGIVDVNVSALVALTHAALPTMQERRQGGILNVSSVAGAVPGAPYAAVYSATKAFVTSFSAAVHEEVREDGVVVTALCPGLTRTEFQERAGYERGRRPGIVWQSAETVAQVGLDAVRKRRVVVTSGAQNKGLVGLMRFAPAGLVRRAAAAMANGDAQG